MSDSTPIQKTCSILNARVMLLRYADELFKQGKNDKCMEIHDVLTHYPKPIDFAEPGKSFASFQVPE